MASESGWHSTAWDIHLAGMKGYKLKEERWESVYNRIMLETSDNSIVSAAASG